MLMETWLAIHVAGAAAGLLSGASALSLKKGSPRHRKAGRIYLVSMLIMAASAVILALAADKLLDALSGLLVCYLVLTSWLTFQPRNPGVSAALIALGVATLTGYLWVEWEASQSGIRRPDIPEGVGFVFAGILLLALTGDALTLRKTAMKRARLIVRHLWRMCFALFMASVSFFLSRAHLFPEIMSDSGLLYVLALAPLACMFYWQIHTRLAQARYTN